MRNERGGTLIIGQIVTGIRERRNRVDHRKTVLDGEIVVSLVTARNGHDGTGTIVHEHIVGREHRQLGTGDRVDRVQAGEQTRLLTVVGHTVGRGLCLRELTVCGYGLARRGIATRPRRVHTFRPGLGHMLQHRVFGRDHTERGTEQRVGSCGVDLHICHLTVDRHLEMHGGAMRLPDPVALHELDLLRPVDSFLSAYTDALNASFVPVEEVDKAVVAKESERGYR